MSRCSVLLRGRKTVKPHRRSDRVQHLAVDHDPLALAAVQIEQVLAPELGDLGYRSAGARQLDDLAAKLRRYGGLDLGNVNGVTASYAYYGNDGRWMTVVSVIPSQCTGT